MSAPVERLRAAEQRLRDVAGAATPGPWVVVQNVPDDGRADVSDSDGNEVAVDDRDYGSMSAADARYIAAMAPPVALALADWLAEAVQDTEFVEAVNARTAQRAERTGGDGHTWVAQSAWIGHALAVADAILGSES